MGANIRPCSETASVASIDATELEALPAEAQAFHRRARIVDAAVREIAEHGYDQVAEEAIAERAGVTRRVVLRHLRRQGGGVDVGLRRRRRLRDPADPAGAARRSTTGSAGPPRR